MPHIYLDHNSTSIIDPLVAREVAQALDDCYANPASQHAPGQHARRVLEDCRSQISEALGAHSGDRLVFTSGGTEANNLAIFGLCGPRGSNVIFSAIEHPSVMETARQLNHLGIEVRLIRAQSSGAVDLDALPGLIDERTTLVSLMLANNETGVIQNVARAAQICRTRGVRIHTDAVQAVARIDVRFHSLGVDALSLAAHKFHGPRGIGGLLFRSDVDIAPLLHGGLQQTGVRPGTEDVALVVGMCGAFLRWHKDREARHQTLYQWRDEFESSLLAALPDAVIIGRDQPRLPQTICVAFPGVNRQALFMMADLNEIAISTGSACASGSSSPSPALLRMGLPSPVIDGAIRISFGVFNRHNDLQRACQKLVGFVKKLREKPTRQVPR